MAQLRPGLAATPPSPHTACSKNSADCPASQVCGADSGYPRQPFCRACFDDSACGAGEMCSTAPSPQPVLRGLPRAPAPWTCYKSGGLPARPVALSRAPGLLITCCGTCPRAWRAFLFCPPKRSCLQRCQLCAGAVRRLAPPPLPPLLPPPAPQAPSPTWRPAAAAPGAAGSTCRGTGRGGSRCPWPWCSTPLPAVGRSLSTPSSVAGPT